MKKLISSGFATLVSLTIFAGQALCSINNIQIVPENPTSCDIVVITLSGGWGSSCIPNASAISVEGNDIYFDVIWDYPPGILCADVLTSWEQTRSAGPLAPGTYTVYARIIGYPPIPEEYTLIAEFTVTDKQFVLSTELLTVPEGGTETFTVALLLEPAGTVEVSVARESGDTDIMVQSGGTLFFDSSNYSVPQMVTLAAAEDEDYLDGAATISISAPAWIPATVIATESDNYYAPPVLYVDAKAPEGVKTGTSWEDAFIDLQEALDLAFHVSDVEEIRVAQGIYTPAGPSGDRNATFQLLTNVALRGGYAGFGEPDPNARDMSVYETILSGDLNRDDGPNFANRGDNSFHVVTSEGMNIDQTTVLDGFIITGGNSNDGGHYKGGGIFNHYGSPTIANCTFTGNSAYSRGGGMYDVDGSPTLINCAFIENSASYGGGIACSYGSSLTLTNCTFSKNVVSWYGGGIECWCASNLTAVNCTFNCNSAGEGGGIYSFNTNCTLINCIFSRNSAVGGDRKEGYGGGMYSEVGFPGGQTTIVMNCTFSGNSSVAETGGGIYYIGGSIINCVLWGNHSSSGVDESNQISMWYPSSVNYCCVQGWTGALGGTGNIDSDPCFVDAANGDYRLLPASPCINAGDPNYILEPNETDLDGNPRIVDGRIDMGAYEFPGMLQAKLFFVPSVLNTQSRRRTIVALLAMPEGILRSDINQSELLVFTPGNVIAQRQYVFQWHKHGRPCTWVMAVFNKSDCMPHLSPGQNQVEITGKLNDGRYFYGNCNLRVNSPTPPRNRRHRRR